MNFIEQINDYYKEIKNQLVNNEVYKRVKDYSKNKSDLDTYYNVGKLLSEAGKQYGENIINEYSIKLTNELGKKYSRRTLFRMKQFYSLFKNQKVPTLSTQLCWGHYTELLSLNDINEIDYYIKITKGQSLSVRELRDRIKNKEYERLDNKTKEKLIKKEENKIEDFIKNPILINNKLNYTDISEKILKQLILEDLDNFLNELGIGFTYIRSEYKIKLGDRYNYIDILLFNIKFNCYVVVELKVTELKKEHIGQIQLYMNYTDKNIKDINQNKTIGIIIVKKDNKLVMEYCTDNRIFETVYIVN